MKPIMSRLFAMILLIGNVSFVSAQNNVEGKEIKKTILMNPTHGDSCEYTLNQIVSAISQESNKCLLAWFSYNESGKWLLQEKIIDNTKAKKEIIKWFEKNFELLTSKRRDPENENAAVRPNWEFSIFSGASPWGDSAKRFQLYDKNIKDDKEFKKLFNLFEQEGKDHK